MKSTVTVFILVTGLMLPAAGKDYRTEYSGLPYDHQTAIGSRATGAKNATAPISAAYDHQTAIGYRATA